MATVHPSRLALVAGAREAQAASSRTSAPPAAGSSSVSREDELRRQLLDRRRQGRDGYREQSDSNLATSRGHVGASGGHGERGTRAREPLELLPVSAEKTTDSDRLSRSPHSPRTRHAIRSPTSPSRSAERMTADRFRENGLHESREYRSDARASRGLDDREARRYSPSYELNSPSGSGQNAGPSSRLAASNGHMDYGYGKRDDLHDNQGHMRPPLRFELNSNGGARGWQKPPPHRGFLTQADLERRRIERKDSTLSIWPKSPDRPYRDEDQLEAERKARRKAKKSSARRRRRYSDETSSSSDEDRSDEEERRRRRRRKENERRRKDSDTDDADAERRRKRRRAREKAARRSERERNGDVDVDEDGTGSVRGQAEWVEVDDRYENGPRSPVDTTETGPGPLVSEVEEEDGMGAIGPHLPGEAPDRYRRAAYSHMLKGEAEAMARFAASGQRIPRRGEIGLDTNKIEAFEESGYVMSGSRHKRMNAVRLRKENQVINDQEKRALLRLQREENERKEGAIISQFREVISERLATIEGKKAQEGLDEAGEKRDDRLR